MKSKAIKNITSSGTIKIIFSLANSLTIEKQCKSIDFLKKLYQYKSIRNILD